MYDSSVYFTLWEHVCSESLNTLNPTDVEKKDYFAGVKTKRRISTQTLFVCGRKGTFLSADFEE